MQILIKTVASSASGQHEWVPAQQVTLSGGKTVRVPLHHADAKRALKWGMSTNTRAYPDPIAFPDGVAATPAPSTQKPRQLHAPKGAAVVVRTVPQTAAQRQASIDESWASVAEGINKAHGLVQQ